MSPDYAAEWSRKAEADRAAAKRAFQDSRKRADQAEIACFHAQQCAEKYLKALIALSGAEVPRLHDLLALARLAKKLRVTPRFQNDLRSLNHYAVEIRYPGATSTVKEAAHAISAMERAASRIILALRGPAKSYT